MATQKNAKFQLTAETVTHWTGVKLYRIKALKTFRNVTKGDLGGFVEALKNLDADGDAWISGDARIYGNAWISGNAQIYGNAQISGDARIYGNAWISGDARIYGNAWIYGNARIYGNAWKIPPLQIQGSRHFVNLSTHSTIKIGCYKQAVDVWVKTFEQIGKDNGYTPGQIKEYKLYIDLCEKWITIHKAELVEADKEMEITND